MGVYATVLYRHNDRIDRPEYVCATERFSVIASEYFVWWTIRFIIRQIKLKLLIVFLMFNKR